MYAYRTSHGPVALAFTDRHGGVSGAPYDDLNLALDGDDSPEARADNHRILLDDFAPADDLRDLRQVHGATVVLAASHEETGADGPARPDADGIVTADPGLTLMVRAADCVPVLLADAEARVIGAAHAGRLGLERGVVPTTVRRMRDLGAGAIQAWIGPHICGACYEVPADLQAAVAAVEPTSRATTSWGTPSLDIGAGVRAQLEREGVDVAVVGACTRESADLYSYRRDGAAAGRQAGVIRLEATR